MLQVETLSKSFGDRTIFDSISFSIDRGQKVGLIATNGSGKTTLMNILTGVEPYDGGKVIFERDIRFSYLSQIPSVLDQQTVLKACLASQDSVAQLVLSWQTALETGDNKLMESLLPEMEARDGWAYEQRAKEILGALGLHDIHKSVAHSSGGEAKRIALASVLVSEPELLFLDEPTNHLDLDAIEWLEDYLSRSTMSLLLVTHDRYFLDRICDQIIELDNTQLYRYKGNYNYYLTKRDEMLTAQAAQASKAQNLMRRELEWMRRQPQARATKAQYRIDAFHTLKEQIEGKRSKSQSIKLTAEAGYIGKKIIEAHGVSKAYGDKVILRNFDYTFSRYDKIGIVGANGVGKTTFIKMLLGLELTDSGHFDVGQTVRFGYYSQSRPEFDPNKVVIDVLKDIAETFVLREGQSLSASQILTQFLFPPERQHIQVGKLSGGELRRLYLCTVLVRQPNFLILDEPTNDLDIATLQVLEEYLLNFSGCVLIVSHDRFFMDKITEHLLCFEGDGQVRDFPGNYSQYRAHSQMQRSEGTPTRSALPSSNKTNSFRPERRSTKKLTYIEKKELENIIEELKKLEEEQKELEITLNSGSLSSENLLEASQRISIVIERLDELTLRQLELEDKEA